MSDHFHRPHLLLGGITTRGRNRRLPLRDLPHGAGEGVGSGAGEGAGDLPPTLVHSPHARLVMVRVVLRTAGASTTAQGVLRCKGLTRNPSLNEIIAQKVKLCCNCGLGIYQEIESSHLVIDFKHNLSLLN